MCRWMHTLALATCCLVAAMPEASLADKRAFVVGINGYVGLPVLKTAVSDATAASKSLGDLGFRVDTVIDPDRADFERKWADYLGSLKPGDVALFYFAGHGVQVEGGANYLLPRDTPKVEAGEASILERALNFHELMEALEARRPAASLYILDACRSNPFKPGDKQGKSKLGQTKGLAPIESVYGAFVMYSAGPNEEALDYLRDPAKEANSVYTRRLLPLVGSAELSLVDVAKRLQVQVAEDARSVEHKQHPAYFDGIVGQYYLNRLDSAGKTLGPADRIPGDNVVRLGAFATWDASCSSRPAPRINVVAAPKHGRIITRYETFAVAANHFGNACPKASQRGVGVYYVIDEASKESTTVDSVQFAVNHWSVAPVTTVRETFVVDLATRYSRRTTQP